MKKIAFVLLSCVSAGAFAAATAVPTDGAVSATACTYLKEAIKVNMSKDVKGAYECSATKVGFAAAAVKGKGKTFSVNSDGGVIVEAGTTPFADADAAASAAGTAATAAFGTTASGS